MRANRKTNVMEPKIVAEEAIIDEQKIKDIAKDLADKTDSDNLLNFCETDENGHTKFLHEILRRGKEDYPCFLKSFFEVLNCAIFRPEEEDEASGNEEPSLFGASACKELQLRNQYKYIDELITFENEEDETVAIIIENKACRAPDQNSQLDRYICACSPGPCTCQEEKKAEKKEIASHNTTEINATKIFVVYLTKDGGEPPPKSLSEDKKKGIENRRPICINYKENILPWLREDVLPECKQKDAGFIRSLQMYVDFLEGFVYEKTLPSEVEKKLSDVLKEKLGIEFEETVADGVRASEGKLEDFENVYKNLKPQERTEEETAAQENFIASQLSYFYAKPANSFKRLSDEYWKTKYGDKMATNIKKSIGWNNKYIWYGLDERNKGGKRIHVEWDVSPNGDYKKQKNDLNGADTLFAALYKVKLRDIRLKIHFEVGKENHVPKDQLPEGTEHLTGRGQIWMPPRSWTEDKEAISTVALYQKSLCIKDEDAEFNLDCTFADLNEDERRTFLTALYDKAAECLNFVYDKMEEHK